MLQKFTNLTEFQKAFSTPLKCINHIIELRWNGVLTCPRCNQSDMAYKHKTVGLFSCGHCRKQFTVKIGTIFEDSPLPLTKWFMAFYLEINTIKGVSSHQLANHIGVCQKTAWHILQKIRWALANKTIEKFKGDIQVDETYCGGLEGNKHANKKRMYTQGGNTKMVVLGILETGGRVALEYVRKSNIDSIKPVLNKYIDFANATLNTDESPLYKGYQRNIVNHSKKQYRNGKSTTNGIESTFSHFKRMVLGVFMHISRKHIDKYLNTFCFRFNNRALNANDKFNIALSAMFGKRIMHAELTS